MSDLVRFSVSLEQPLFDRLEKLVAAGDYSNRSEYIRDMIRDRLVEQQWERNELAIGTITLVYDHHSRMLSEKLTDLQHDHHDEILASTHVHLSHDICVEMILMKGRADRIKTLADKLRQQRGVLHGTLSISSTGQSLPH